MRQNIFKPRLIDVDPNFLHFLNVLNKIGNDFPDSVAAHKQPGIIVHSQNSALTRYDSYCMTNMSHYNCVQSFWAAPAAPVVHGDLPPKPKNPLQLKPTVAMHDPTTARVITIKHKSSIV